MKDIYLIPGLGADRRVFEFLDLSCYSCNYLTWIEPLKNESIESYAYRLSTQIKSSDPILIGVSFGGILAIEIGKQIKTQQIILISSARTKSEIPMLFRSFGKASLHKLLPKAWLKGPKELIFYFFGVKEPVEKELLASIIDDTDLNFLQWAIDKIVRWKNEIVPEYTTLIHGSKDRLLPNNKGDVVILGGGHFMIVNKGKEVSDTLNLLLS